MSETLPDRLSSNRHPHGYRHGPADRLSSDTTDTLPVSSPHRLPLIHIPSLNLPNLAIHSHPPPPSFPSARHHRQPRRRLPKPIATPTSASTPLPTLETPNASFYTFPITLGIYQTEPSVNFSNQPSRHPPTVRPSIKWQTTLEPPSPRSP